MNWSILIADDEEIECKALSMQIQKAFPEITVLKPVRNGLELMDSARANRPDIVIADIEMPGMNGLMALEQLRTEGIRPYIVIMTAYSSEHYLKESLSLRVHEYLEKPIRRERMANTIRSLLEEMERERSKEAEFAQKRDAIRSMHKMIQSELMTNIESDEADASQTAELLDMLEMNASRYMVMTFSMAETVGKADFRYARSLAELNVFEEIRRLVREKGWLDGHIINHRMSCLVPVDINVKEDDYRLRQIACCEADEILQRLDPTWRVRIGIGVSAPRPHMLQKSRQQSIQALYSQDKHSAICHYEDQPIPPGVENLFATEEAALREYILSGNEEQAKNCIRRCFASLPEWVTFDVLRIQAFELLLALNRGSQLQLFDELLKRVTEEMIRCTDKTSLENYIIKLCMECIQRNCDSDKHWQDDIIEQAKRYIDVCYHADISLESTAEAIGVSKFYLSRLFKTRLGMNYSTYLTEKRVKRAETLMQTRRKLTNREIAELVGFKDPDYFGKVFKKQTGFTIKEYRDLIN